jgi:GNAT superfamily N-acetyltransferase
MVSLRPFEPGDAAVCCEIINAAIQTMDGLNAQARALVVSKNDPESVGADLARSFTLVAVGQEGVEGLGVLDGIEIRRVYVRPKLQSQGTGTRLVRALEDEARKRGQARIELQASLSSVGFYRALGYQEGAKETSRNGDAEFIHVRMSRDLESSQR